MGYSVACFLLLLLVAAGPAVAQMGVPNTPQLSPGPPAPPFGGAPSPFNDPHPAQPWNSLTATGGGVPVREFVVPSRTVILPMELAMPGGLAPVLAQQTVTIPEYQVTETTLGFVVHEHWGVEPRGSAFYWTWRPTYFQRKR